MANDYCSSSDIKAHLPESGLASTTDYDDMLGQLCTSASRLIDAEVGYWPGFFYPTTDDETRYFDGNGEKELDVDPMVSLTSVSVSEEGNTSSSDYTSWTENTDFYVWPYNYSSIGQPIQRLVIDINSDKGNWRRFRKCVSVTGVFGYSSTAPSQIKEVAIIQATRWYMRSKQAWQDAAANIEIGRMQYVRELDPDVKKLLQNFMLWFGK